MSSIAEEEATSSTDRGYLSEFQFQPYYFSVGYEPLPGDDREYTVGRINHAHKLQRKIRALRCTSYSRELTRWREFKKPLDERRLRRAVSMNDTNTVQHLLDKGVSARCYDTLKRTPLHLAACKGFTHLVQMLLEHGADPNARDSIGNTPLHLAACTNNIAVIMILLKAGTDANCLDILGRNPLQLAQSKLRILKKNSKDSGREVKEQVHQVIEMLLMFSHNEEMGFDANMLEAFQNNLKLTNDSREQVETQLNGLLDSLSSLNIDSNGSQ